MIEAVKYGFANYARFDGRTGRATFWWWMLAVILAFLVATILDGGPGRRGIEPFRTLLVLVILLPHLAMAVRRLHDINRTGWWVLAGLIPFLGTLLLIYFYVQPSNPAGERFDPPGPARMPPEPPPAA